MHFAIRMRVKREKYVGCVYFVSSVRPIRHLAAPSEFCLVHLTILPGDHAIKTPIVKTG
jgi:hypothetical protein